MSKRSSSSIDSSSASASDAKRPKFDELVSELSNREFGKSVPKASSLGGVVLGALPEEEKNDQMVDADDDEEAGISRPPLTAEEEMDAILQLVNEAPEVPELTESDVRTILSRFSKAVAKNQEQRARYPDEPMKFLESELALDEACTALIPISSNSSFYPLLLVEQSGTGDSTMNTLCTLLLNHENIDVSIDALNLLHEIIDAEELDTDDERLHPFIDYVCSLTDASTFVATLVRALGRFPVESSKQFADAITHILAIIENLTDLKPKEVSQTLVDKTDLVEWIMKRMKPEMFDANKLYASEILSIVLTSTGISGQIKIGEQVLNGMGMKALIKLIAVSTTQNISTVKCQLNRSLTFIFFPIPYLFFSPSNRNIVRRIHRMMKRLNMSRIFSTFFVSLFTIIARTKKNSPLTTVFNSC